MSTIATPHRPTIMPLPIRLTLCGLLIALAAATQGCGAFDDGRPREPNAATRTADTANLGPSARAPDCYIAPVRNADGAYPGPGPYGIVHGYVASGLDASCRWRQASASAMDAVVELYAAGPDGELETDDDELVARTSPAATGCYAFEEIGSPGSYFVRIAEPAVATCDDERYEDRPAGVAHVNIHPIAGSATVSFGVVR